jgi:N-methylhydantoinase B
MAGSHVPVPVRAEVIVRTGGGGGFGDPLERDPQAVRNDVLEEFITAASAREDYGVVLRDDLTLDEAATGQARDAIKSRVGKIA